MAQAVSQAWRDHQQETFLNEAFVEVFFDMGDPDAIADASATDDGGIYFSNSAQIVDTLEKEMRPYATLEQNLWLLNGQRQIVPTENFGDNGYISDRMSKSDCSFDSPPTIHVHFSEKHMNLIPGLTFVWGSAYEEFPRTFLIEAYDGNTLIADKLVTENLAVISVIDIDLSGYDKIVVSVLDWSLPFHRARVEEIFIGQRIIYGKTELLNYDHQQTADPVSLSLPKSEIRFSVDNTDNLYNPYNPVGRSKYLMERQRVRTRYGYRLGGGREWIKGGEFYLSEWEAPQNGLQADFTARDLLEFMTQTYNEGVYAPDGVSLFELAERVILKAKLPTNEDGTNKWFIHPSLMDITTVAPLPVCTLAECLQLIANAACCVLYQDRDGILRIEPIGEELPDYDISLFNSYEYSTITLSKPLQQIDVNVHSYLVAEEETELFNGTVEVSGTEDVALNYSSPAVDVSATLEGGTVNSAEYFTNGCTLNITGSGDVIVVLRGKVLSKTDTTLTIPNEETGEVRTFTNELLTDDTRARIVGTWVKDFLKHRTKLSSNWRADPRLDVLDWVMNENEYGENRVRMTDFKLSFSGAFTGDGEGRVIDGMD